MEGTLFQHLTPNPINNHNIIGAGQAREGAFAPSAHAAGEAPASDYGRVDDLEAGLAQKAVDAGTLEIENVL
jgi:hypothetical protein